MCEQFKLFRLYVLANIPNQYMDLDWSEFPDPVVRGEVENFVENIDALALNGIGIEFYGPRLGVGKTWGGTHVIKAAVKAGYTAFFVSFVDIINMMHDEARGRIDLTRNMIDSDFLMVDEIRPPVSEAQRTLFEEKLEWIVRQRAACNMSTITATNLTQEETELHYPRVSSVLSGHQTRLELSGSDYRKSGKGFDDRINLALLGERRPLT